MSLSTIIFIAIALSMDAFAIAIASGFTIEKLKIKHALRIALAFGLFQFLMPVVGWFAGVGLKSFISGIDHWIAFALLTFVGGKMIYEGIRMEPEEKTTNPLKLSVLFILSIATSIDALAVGLSLSLLNISILTPALIIGCITFSISFAGVYIGKKLGHFFESKIEIVGGLILVGIGIKILIEHLK